MSDKRTETLDDFDEPPDVELWALINRQRAATGLPPLTEADFAKFDKFMCDPDGGPLVL